MKKKKKISRQLFKKGFSKKTGKSFFYSTENGKRVGEKFYRAQFNSDGKRVGKGLTKKVVNFITENPDDVMIEGFDLKDSVSKIVDSFEKIEEKKIQPQKKVELQFKTDIQYWDLRTEIAENKDINTYMIKLVGSDRYGRFSKERALELMEIYQQAINSEVVAFNKKYKADNIYINPSEIFQDVVQTETKQYLDLNLLEVNGVEGDYQFEFMKNLEANFRNDLDANFYQY